MEATKSPPADFSHGLLSYDLAIGTKVVLPASIEVIDFVRVHRVSETGNITDPELTKRGALPTDGHTKRLVVVGALVFLAGSIVGMIIFLVGENVGSFVLVNLMSCMLSTRSTIPSCTNRPNSITTFFLSKL